MKRSTARVIVCTIWAVLFAGFMWALLAWTYGGRAAKEKVDRFLRDPTSSGRIARLEFSGSANVIVDSRGALAAFETVLREGSGDTGDLPKATWTLRVYFADGSDIELAAYVSRQGIDLWNGDDGSRWLWRRSKFQADMAPELREIVERLGR